MPSDTSGMTASQQVRYESTIARIVSGEHPPCPSCGSTAWAGVKWREKTETGTCDQCPPDAIAAADHLEEIACLVWWKRLWLGVRP